MFSSEEVKNLLERLHTDYLTRNFLLERSRDSDWYFNGLKPDLVVADGERITIELKSRLFPKEQEGRRKRPISDYCWWRVWPAQYEGYENFEVSGFRNYWMFMIANGERDATKLPEVSEEIIHGRNIWLVPWSAHKLVKETPSGCKNIGLASLLRAFEFEEIETKGSIIKIASEAKELIPYFSS